MTVDDWFWGFVQKHCERFPRGDWPGGDAEYWQELRHLFVVKGVTEDVATAASREMFQFPAPEFVSEHPAVLLARIRGVWAAEKSRAVPTRPDAQAVADGCYSDWDRAAYAHWDSISEADREESRHLVRERAPFFVASPEAAEMLAVGWAYDPSSVIAPEPKREPRPALPRGVKQVFQHPKFVE